MCDFTNMLKNRRYDGCKVLVGLYVAGLFSPYLFPFFELAVTMGSLIFLSVVLFSTLKMLPCLCIPITATILGGPGVYLLFITSDATIKVLSLIITLGGLIILHDQFTRLLFENEPKRVSLWNA